MKKLSFILLSLLPLAVFAQNYNQLTDTGEFIQGSDAWGNRKDTLRAEHRETPRGLKVWTVDERLGERVDARPDTLQHMFMNTIFTTGLRGEYSSTGNLGAPRYNRIFIDNAAPQQFMFTQPYDFFITPVGKFLFTNTLSPITNITYNECGDRTNGEDHLKALFAVNAGKRFGAGFKFDYIYGRGYYQNQSTSHFNYTMYASYLGDRYNAHLLLSTNHQKVTENGGITDDRYITNPEVFNDTYRENEIPTMLQQNWNRNDNQHIFFTQRYSVGFNRKVKMTEEEIKARKFAIQAEKENKAARDKERSRRRAQAEGRDYDEDEEAERTFAGRPANATIAGDEPADTVKTNGRAGRIAIDKQAADSLLAVTPKTQKDTAWLKNEYVPVTSFIHTLQLDNYRRIYQAYDTPTDYYAATYYDDGRFGGDSIYDKTRHYRLRNTFGIALLEGFNKWAKAGLRVFATSELRHFTLPSMGIGTDSYNEHNLSVGGQLIKTQGSLLHYDVTAETWLAGEDVAQLKIDAKGDLNFRLWGDTVTLAAHAFFHSLHPTFYYRHYHAKHFFWDNDGLNKEIRTHIEGLFTLRRTRTSLRVAIDNLKDYTYFAQQYQVTQAGSGSNAEYTRTGNMVKVKQASGNISLLTLQLSQDFTLGPLNWESVITYQKSSDAEVIPVPDLNVYTNLYLRFKIARVLSVDLGGDLRYFTKYKALDYCPGIGQFTVQDNGTANVEVGNYPLVNVYANMHLKQTRFFVMMSHVNASTGRYFFAPHHPLNGRVFRFGLSWNFFN